MMSKFHELNGINLLLNALIFISKSLVEVLFLIVYGAQSIGHLGAST